MNDEELLSGFESCTLPAEHWTHRAHVQVAFSYASRNNLAAAIERMRSGLKAYSKARDTPNAIDSGYHETVTVAFVRLVYAANLQTGPHESSQSFCNAHPELLNGRALSRYYSRQHLMTWEAKANFITPDQCPLPTVIGNSLTIDNVTDGAGLEMIKNLFIQYAESLDYQFCFADFDSELSGLPGCYKSPIGRLLLARDKDQPTGCVGLRPLADTTCEMKRLWVRPQFRETGLGRHLVTAVIDEARAAGYQSVRLKTTLTMKAAIQLYRSLGFTQIETWTEPEPDVLCMELNV